MMKILIIVALVVAVIGGGLLTLRNSRSGMPSEDVLKRATKRAQEQSAKEDD